MAIAMPAYQQESANPITAWILYTKLSFLREWTHAFECSRYAKIQDSVCKQGTQESFYKPFEVVKASEFSPVETVDKSIDPSLTIHNSLWVYFRRAARAHMTDRLLCCTQSENHDEHQGIDWHTSYKIIKGICEGLVYLHEKRTHPIIHMDLKPAIILLDDEMVPKITDFGLSRYFGEEKVPNMRSSIGTRGYMLPEYMNGNVISYKLDIYSLGLIILKIITGNVDKATAAAEEILQAYSSNETMQDARSELISSWEEYQIVRQAQISYKEDFMKLHKWCHARLVRLVKYAFTRVQHTLIQMVLFANHLHGNEFCCPKSMAPKSITDIVERSPSSASRNVYEAGWVPAEYKRELSQFARAFGIRIPVKTADRSSHVSSTQRAGRDIFVVDYGDCMSDAGEMKTLTTTFFTSSNMDKAPTGADLRQQLAQNNLADERNEKPRSNSAPSDTSSDQTARVPKKHKLTNDESQNNSDPNSCVTKGDTKEEAKRSGKWYVATGAAQHATGDRGVITNLQELENNDLCVHAADGTPMPVHGIGSVVTDTVVLPDVYYVPGLWTNLVSVGQLAGLDYCIGFSRGACHVSDAAGTVVGTAHARGDGLYEVDFLRIPLGISSTGS